MTYLHVRRVDRIGFALRFTERDRVEIRIPQGVDRLEALCHVRGSCAALVQVDPDELGIPDYYDIVDKPLDLGTIQVSFCEARV